VLNIDGNFIPKYMENRQMTGRNLSKYTGLDIYTIHKISENIIPLRFIAFYRITKVLGIQYDSLITDKEQLSEYNEYLKDHEREIKMPKIFYKMVNKRSSLLDRQFKELLEEL